MTQETQQNNKSFFKRFLRLGIILASILLIFTIACNKGADGNKESGSGKDKGKDYKKSTGLDKGKKGQFGSPSIDAKYITASPIDLTQTGSISKFRSCEGHDFSGTNFQGQQEADRSMKHYVTPLASIAFSNNKVKVFAPFNGTVFNIVPQLEGTSADDPKARGGSIILVSKLDPNAAFDFGHVNPLKGIKEGSKVVAGQHIGYAIAREGNYDLVIKAIENSPDGKNKMSWNFDSMFNHMTDKVLAKFAKAGFAKNLIIIEKEARDKKSCNFEDSQNQGGINIENWIFTKQGLADYKKDQNKDFIKK